MLPLYRFLTPGPEVLFQRRFGEMLELGIHAFLLRSQDTTVLVDTGLPRDFEALNDDIRRRKGAAAGFRPFEERLPDLLDRRGIVLDAIVLSSFGLYAVGGVEDFPRVPLYVSARGCADLEWPEEVALVHPLPDALRARLLGAKRIAGEQDLFPGMAMIETGVHHPASSALVAATRHGRIGIADPVFVAENLIEGHPLGAAEHAAGWHRMARLLADRCDAIIPIHDPNPQPLPKSIWHPSIRVQTGQQWPTNI